MKRPNRHGQKLHTGSLAASASGGNGLVTWGIVTVRATTTEKGEYVQKEI